MRRILLSITVLLASALPGAAADSAGAKNAFVLPGDTIIPQIANGGGSFFMTFEFMGITDSAATVTLAFFDSAGNAMSVPYIQDGVELTATTLIETVGLKGIEFARTKLDAETVQTGYARVSSAPENAVAVSASFNQVVADRPLFRAFIPLDSVLHSAFFVPAINSGTQTASMAIVSLLEQDVAVVARNTNGVELCRVDQQFNGGQHMAFLVRDQLPCTAGINAIVEVAAGDENGLAGFGLTAEDSGAFSTQPVYGPLP